MHRSIFSAVVGGVIAIASQAAADSPRLVQRSGSTYHIAACPSVVAHAARCHAHVVTDAKGNLKSSAQPPVSGFGPADLRDAYKITGNGNSGTIVAIVDAFGYNNAEADLGVYRANFGLSSCTTANGCFKKLNQSGQEGNYPAQDVGWAQESALDLDMASAMCPGCKVYLFEATTNSYSNLAATVRTAASFNVHVISNSYGGGESGTQSYEPSYNQRNIAVTVSSGDSGYGAGPQFPASSPHVIAVGGTHLVHDGSSRGWNETVWGGAGSGCSNIYTKQKWQKDSGCSRRTIADVSAVSDPNTGVAVYGPINSTQSAWLVFGGTSVAAPLIGGIYGVNGGSVRYAKSLYKNKTQLFDVTSGSNGSCGGSYLCTGKVGYDGPTGLGTPNGSGLAFGG